MAVSADRVRQLLAWRGKIERAPRPLVLPDETEVRLELDGVFAELRGRRL